jgi:AraC-like DNA-binding protein
MDYREYPVPEDLRRLVKCAWRLEDGEPGGAARTIYPDGHCELIVHLKSPPQCWDPATGWHRQAATLFAAQRVTAVRLRAVSPIDCVGLRLQPAASGSLAAHALAQHRDHIVDLAAVDASFSKVLRTAVRAFASGSDTSLWQLLRRRAGGQPLDARIEAAVYRLQCSAGKSRIDSAARASGMSMRAFQTRFSQAVGLTPKEFARLMRLKATLHALDSSSASITELAADTGFADQAHATRELLRVTGLTPAKLRTELRRDRDGAAAVRLAAAFVRGYSD